MTLENSGSFVDPSCAAIFRSLPHKREGAHFRSRQAFLGVRVQNPAARFGQRERGEEIYGVSRYRENRNGVAERGIGRERADQERKQRADAAAEIVAEALARSAQPGRIELGEECADAGEVSRREEAERETEQPKRLVVQRQLSVE